MKRTRVSISTKEKLNASSVGGENIECYSGVSFVDLPRSLLVIILLKLSVKRVVICKCVCKAWYYSISDPEFAKLHFQQSEIFPLIRTSNGSRVSRVLYLLQPEQSQDFDPGFDRYSGYSFKNYCRRDNVNMKLETKLKLPLRNFESSHIDGKLVQNFDSQGTAKRKEAIDLRPTLQKYKIVNSCNGLLCLSEPTRNVPLAVCNPVTSEFVKLPETCIPDYRDTGFKSRSDVNCGLGFSPVSNQYKVVKMFDHYICSDATGKPYFDCKVAEVNTLGNGSWRSIGKAPFVVDPLHPVYLNGSLHWYSRGRCIHSKDCITYFDIENECFQSFSAPPNLTYFIESDISMGVLGGCLCMCCPEMLSMYVWVMKDYGVENSWIKMFSIDTDLHVGWPVGLYQPLKEMNDGGLLFFHYPKSALIYYHPDKFRYKSRYRYHKVRGVKSKFEAIAHTPSFVSLKDALQGDDVQVINVYSRCGLIKVPGEARPFYLMDKLKYF